MKRALVVSVIFSLLSAPFLPLKEVGAADCSDSSKIFSSNYDLTYSFNKQGVATVTQKVSLKNLTSTCFASEYSLSVNSTKVKSASGEDSLGKLFPEIKATKQTTTITTKLNDEVIGKNKTAPFTLQYSLEGLAKKNSLVWDVSIPKIATSEQVTSFKLKVSAPSSFGKIFSVSTSPTKITYGENRNDILFGGKELINKGISISFGEHQEINFKMNLPIENSGLLSTNKIVYLPPDTEGQRVFFKKINPKPTKISLDEDGNYLAEYLLKGGEVLEVEIEGSVRIVNSESRFVPPLVFGEEKLQELTKASQTIEVQDRLIQQQADKLKTYQEIYDFVVGYLDYDYQALKNGQAQRKRASAFLREKQSATNLGFVDLFVAIAKASGIPAREVFGFTLQKSNQQEPIFVSEPLNSQKIHVWAQVFDEESNRWLNVDPTWARTSGVDFLAKDTTDRFALFISGSGEVKKPEIINLIAENTEISAAKEQTKLSPDISLDIQVDQIFAGFPAEVIIKIENKSGVSFTGSELKVNAQNVSLIGKEQIQIPVIFPYETKVFNFKVRGGSLFNSKEGNISLDLSGNDGLRKLEKKHTKPILVKSFFSIGTQQILLLFIVILLIVGIFSPKLNKFLKK